MRSKFELIAKKNKMDLEFSKKSFQEAIESGNGFVMIYRDKNDNRYYMVSSGFTQEEGIYASHLISRSVIIDDDDPDGLEENVLSEGGL